MKLSCFDDRQKAAERHADFFLNGEPFTDPGLLEACEEEGYILVADWEAGASPRNIVRAFIPEFGSPYGYRTRRLNGEVRIRPKSGKEHLFAACLAWGTGGKEDQAIRDRETIEELTARVEELEAEIERLFSPSVRDRPDWPQYAARERERLTELLARTREKQAGPLG